MKFSNFIYYQSSLPNIISLTMNENSFYIKIYNKVILHFKSLKFSKTIPRFELGIKDLQSSALPLGDIADLYVKLMLGTRLELVTQGFSVLRSTN